MGENLLGQIFRLFSENVPNESRSDCGSDAGSSVPGKNLNLKIEPVSFNSFDRPQRYRITEEGGRWWELSAETTRLAVNHTGDSGLERPTRAQRVNSGDFTTRREGNTLVFNGRGFGHGVGMSQFGAEGMARQGRAADEILMHYYPGAALQRAY